ncbi:hypothetical protein LB105_003392 [Salmonella enterica]|uniref:Lipoprotein n=1 Tax=Salmonella enterica subsp. enterica serovar Panama TaxID=29472 RepID=A0A5U8J846_SALET|nr:YecR family lipoprotein [Salmonella enterica]EBR7993301.1 hypothetical protein [Salmonella enterica subsp. enterica serovar Panama]ECC9937745.1 hypothetical protein [Salmonella enterica subsp. enterica]EEN2094737.1 hypothetical protein [Salmonella enterica subsp. enterica serovar Florida]ASD84972.1 hypothetical protein LFZ16_01140 [Salmonella enterica subsp. enterica serovar India str. SA20085604]EBR8434082.1 hypothetical protein [Salmonella enterica subsp. enterica serovar Panama]
MKAIPKISSMTPALLAFSIPFILAGCAVSELSSTGGSRSDGIVVMSAEYGGFDYLDINTDKALSSAIRRCQSWGYRTAQPFDAGFSKCSDFSGFGCTKYIYSISYQCIE